MRAREVFDFKKYISGQSDHQAGDLDGTSESMGSSEISRNILIWVLVRVDWHTVTALIISGWTQ